jgi:hypothetical protein
VCVNKGGEYMTNDEITGVIPSVRMRGAFGINIYAMVLTKTRIAFIRTEYEGYSGVVGLAAEAATKRNLRKLGSKIITDTNNIQDIDLNSLILSDKANKVLYLINVVEIRLIKGFGGYKMHIFGKKKNKKKLIIEGFIAPPEDYFKEKKKAGQKTKKIMEEYALESQNIIKYLLSDRITSYF